MARAVERGTEGVTDALPEFRSPSMMKMFQLLLCVILSSCSFTEQGAEQSTRLAEVKFSVTHVISSASPLIGAERAEGWTRFEQQSGDRKVYVSSSEGHDSWEGLIPSRPLRSIEAAKKLLRSNHADQLLLKRGDRFDESLGQWKLSGRSAREPMVISSYGSGTERPTLELENASGIVTHGGGGSPSEINHVAIVGIHFRALRPEGQGEETGVSWHQPSRNFLIEDCVFECFSTGLVLQAIGGRHKNMQVRRSVVVDSFNTTGGNPQGIYVVLCDGVLIEECVFDMNGWNPDIQGAGADIYSHNLYIDTNNSALVVRGNIIARGASHGVQLRCGGVAEDNLFLRNSIALMMAGRSGPGRESALARDNVFLEAKNIDEETPRGWGIDFNNVLSGEIAGNILVSHGTGELPLPLMLDGIGNGHYVHNVEVRENIFYGWRGGIRFTGNKGSLENIVFRDNTVHSNGTLGPLFEVSALAESGAVRFGANSLRGPGKNGGGVVLVDGREEELEVWALRHGMQLPEAEPTSFLDPQRSVSEWNVQRGGDDSFDAFMAQARLQSKSLWHEELTAVVINAWIREGFADSSQ